MDLLQHIIGWFVAWRLHRQQRRELLDYLASDHRAAADMGITPYEARQYFDRPFRQGNARAQSPSCKRPLVPAKARTQRNKAN
jgi:uncharacterized protein YjiS (DUF1127 family)